MQIGLPKLTIEDLEAGACRFESVEVAPEARERLARSFHFLQSLVEQDVPIYGLSTGCGPLAEFAIPKSQRESFQRNLVRSHATTLGDPHPPEIVRAAMLLRAHVLALGFSGVCPALVDLLANMLNRRIHPVVRTIGSVGASGDLVELAQIALAAFGEGEVQTETNGPHVDAATALTMAGLVPTIPHYREGLALMNGTCFHSAMAALLVARAERVVSAALIAAAMNVEALCGHSESFDASLHRLRGQRGQVSVAERLRALVRGSQLLRRESVADRQDAYTIRCLPQVIGPVVETIRQVRSVIEAELNAATDNPLFLVDEQRVVHGGNFHGQPVALALDQMKTAVVEVGVVSERRVARLLDPKLNAGLPPFLIVEAKGRAGLRSGFMGLQYCATTLAAENSVLAAPASVRSIPTNANNQDVVSMGVLAARLAGQVISNVERVVAIELVCAAQALDLRGGSPGIGSQAARRKIRDQVPQLIEDRPLTVDVDAALALVQSGALLATVDLAIDGAE